ncbi:hypothetical protein CHU92_14930 [Flavobacterium cyanobacteriorum]|uniref:Uncharacterized protein n=1 Tax=Flavobacterium cyanobacteriorum TaxID=2022802 RepID=A0A255YTI4_9FLAO|nr:hypothetical protein [Flavobacterium cyanobacteriorum]OYQ31935.1 hypothetical protein CHU92_14930 [Flavobacterium cyanobacteriorum]
MKRTLLKIITIVFIVLFAFIYIWLESFYYTDLTCGCSSACSSFYISKTDKIIGYIIIFLSVIVITVSLWKFRKISRWWSILGLLLLGTAIYGNSLMFFNPNICGSSLNESYLYFFSNKIGDWAKTDSEHINMDSLKLRKLDGKFLGYYYLNNDLIIYRIGKKPITLHTNFLFWNICKQEITKHISYGLDSYHLPDNSEEMTILLGGQDMPIQAFMQEVNYNNFSKGLKYQKLLKFDDGTTRLYIYR